MYSAEAEDTETVDSMMMDVSTLRTATGDFDETNKLGEGGFGAVYKVLDRPKCPSTHSDGDENHSACCFGSSRVFSPMATR